VLSHTAGAGARVALTVRLGLDHVWGEVRFGLYLRNVLG